MGVVLRSDRSLNATGWCLAGLAFALFASIPLSLSGGVLHRDR
jgi:hypothetical protein